MYLVPSADFEAVIDVGKTGLVGTIGLRINDNLGATIVAFDDANIAEIADGIYAANTRTAPGTAGQYTLIWTRGDDTSQVLGIEDLVVTNNAPITVIPESPTGKDLCTLADVTGYVPAYTIDVVTDAKLHQLITSESLLIMEESGREIVGPEGIATRTFDISETAAQLRVIPIGDLDGLYDEVVSILNPNGTTAHVVAVDSIVALYEGDRQPTREWEPITELYLPRGASDTPWLLAQWQVIEVVGRWGFPQIPAFIREACARRVILRYVSDVATAGTDFAQAVGESNLNLAAMFNSAEDAVAQLRGRVVLA